jgi:glycosyltransferase involved in cell wall biosynthesis
MKIGINASFLRKPGTGIGQVTENFLRVISQPSFFGGPGKSWQFLAGLQEAQYFLYTEEPVRKSFPGHFMARSFLPKWWKRDDVIRKWLWERQVAREAAEDGCDIFVSLYQSATEFGKWRVTNGELQKIEHVMVVHDIIPRFFPEYLRTWTRRLHFRAVERGIARADRLVALSEYTKETIVSQLGIALEKIVVAPIGLSPTFDMVCTDDRMIAVLKRYDLERGYIYHGGGLEIRKNAEGVLRAYATLRRENQEKMEIPKLVISGKIYAKSNPLATDVVGLVAELGLQECVRLLGFVPEEDLPALYRGALFFVYPSSYEGFGLPPLEAMSQGTPVIVSNTSSLPEVCGDAAVYVDLGHEGSLERGMRLLLIDMSRRSDLSARGMVQVKKFSWVPFVKAILQ